MKPYSDHDIEVLGVAEEKVQHPHKRTRLYWVLALIVAILIAGVSILLYVLLSTPEPSEDELTIESTELSAEIVPDKSAAQELPREYTDSINDVAFKVVCLDGFKASVSFERPDSMSADVVLATTASDYRADNGKIVGEFIHKGEELSTGKRKPGFCYVAPDGHLSIGIGNGEQQKQNAFQNGGTFFRQFALVMEGEIQPNLLKGKSKRRALAFLDGKPAIVMSLNRESIYDFSQALADYGFSHALYLPGGEGYLQLQTDREKLTVSGHPPAENSNYLIFTK